MSLRPGEELTLQWALRNADPHAPLLARVYRSSDLRAMGMTKRDIARALHAGLLSAARRGVYVLADAPDRDIASARVGGRVACVSALSPLGVFVLRERRPHIHFDRATYKRRPAMRTQVWHWAPLVRTPHPRATSVEVIDALIQASSCQSPRNAIATLDSALHLGLIDVDDLDEIFDHVAPRRRVLRRFVDGRAESGPETLVRIMALMLGFEVQVQVRIAGVGRVDLLLDGWLVVECDSEEFHAGWESQKRDRRRDVALAALGLASLRPVAEDIMYNPDVVLEALRGLRAARAQHGATESVPKYC